MSNIPIIKPDDQDEFSGTTYNLQSIEQAEISSRGKDILM
jgi:hypothetical protein